MSKIFNSQKVLELIEKHKGERAFFDGELVGAFFTIGHLENLIDQTIKDYLILQLGMHELIEADFHEAHGIEFRRGAAWAEQILYEKTLADLNK